MRLFAILVSLFLACGITTADILPHRPARKSEGHENLSGHETDVDFVVKLVRLFNRMKGYRRKREISKFETTNV